MLHSFPNNYSQNDPRWANILLGNSSTITLGVAGCYVDAMTNGANYYGHAITPDQMNQKLKDAGLFDGGLISADDDLSKIFSDCQYVQSYFYPNDPPTPADLNLLKDLMSDATKTVIVEIDLGKQQVHFCQVSDCDGTNVTILNSWNGQVQDLKTIYGDPATKILKYIVYQGTPAADPAPDALMQIKQSDFQKLDGKSLELDKIGQELNFDQQTIDSPAFAEKVLEAFRNAHTSTTTPPAPESAPMVDSAPVQPLSTNQTNLLLKFLAMLGLKLELK